MIIILSASVDELEGIPQMEAQSLFCELLRANMLGLHLLVLDRDICTWASESLGLNEMEKAHLRHVKHKFTQLGSLPREAKCFIEVVVGEMRLVEFETHKYRIGHRELLRGNFLEASELFLEHIENDGGILDLILGQAVKGHPIRSYNFRKVHGGGTGIVACLRSSIPARRIAVAIVDSDKYSPNDSSSPTFRNLAVEANRQTYVGMICETPCREAENFIPISILHGNREVICPEYQYFGEIDALLNRQGIAERADCLWLYFDVKNGIEVNKLEAIGNPNVVGWLTLKFLAQNQRFSDLGIGGFGDNLLHNFLNCGAAIGSFVQFMKSDYWSLHFHDFFSEILWYFAADKRRATI